MDTTAAKMAANKLKIRTFRQALYHKRKTKRRESEKQQQEQKRQQHNSYRRFVVEGERSGDGTGFGSIGSGGRRFADLAAPLRENTADQRAAKDIGSDAADDATARLS